MHRLPFLDAFGMAALLSIAEVLLRLNLKACNLLLEEFRRTKELLITDGDFFSFVFR